MSGSESEYEGEEAYMSKRKMVRRGDRHLSPDVQDAEEYEQFESCSCNFSTVLLSWPRCVRDSKTQWKVKRHGHI